MAKVVESFLEPFRSVKRPEQASELYESIYREGRSFNTWLVDHAEATGCFRHDGGRGGLVSETGLDPYEELLRHCNIRVAADPKSGIYAHTCERFFASDQPYSMVLFPEFINRILRQPLIQTNILEEMVTTYTPVDSSAYRSVYLNVPGPFSTNVAFQQMSRVAQSADMPVTAIGTKENVINLFKYGRVLEITYEALRRIQIDLFAVLISRIALQAMLDKAGTALDVAINGDGNSNPAANYNLTALDPNTTALNLTYKAWLAFQLSLYPYEITTVIAGQSPLISLLTMSVPGLNAQNVFTLLRPGPVNDQFDMPQGLFNNVRLIYLPSAPTNTLVALDKRFALEQVSEVGGTMTETNKMIRQQFEEIAISEVVGFDKILQDGIRTLYLDA